MQISHFTARKQIGYKLPAEAFRALSLLEQCRSGLLQQHVTLRTNLMRLDNLVGLDIGLSQSKTVFVDFDTNHDQEVPTINEAEHVIATYARVALALERFLPGTLESGTRQFAQYDVGGTKVGAGEVPPGKVVHFDNDYVILADPKTGEGSVHFLRNGQPAWTHLDDMSGAASIFWPALTDSIFNEAAEPILPTSNLDEVTAWIMEKAYIPDLENDRTFDLEGHPLREMVTYGEVVYADRDVAVTSSGHRMTVHYTETNGRYAVKILEGAAREAFAGLVATPGLDILDPANPARAWLEVEIEERRRYLATRDAPAALKSAR